MRNLALHTTKSASVPNAHLCATALDLDNNVLYAASARLNADADAEVEIWKLDADEVRRHVPSSLPKPRADLAHM